MQTKRVLKITPILITLNLLVLFAIVGFYTYRLIKYYKIENGESEDSIVLFADEIKKKRSYLDETKGLVYDEKTGVYTYKGEVVDNYLNYSGMTFRILGIDKDGNVKAVSENNVTLIYSGFNKGYKDSYVNKWLNTSEAKYSGIYESNLVNSDELLTKSYFCSDTIDDVNNITCDSEVTDYKITLLSLSDYKASGGKSGFLNNGDTFNLGTLNKEGLNYYVTGEGDVTIHQKTTTAITLKPVITIKGSTELIDGNGKEDTPYIVEEHEVETLQDVYVGKIVKLNDKNYKVIAKVGDRVKVISVDPVIDSEGNPLLIEFGGNNNVYKDTNDVYKYLHNTFLNTLDLKDSVVESKYFIGTLSLDNYDYTKVMDDYVNAKVGLSTIGEMYVNENKNTLTILRGFEEINLINVINEEGNLFADSIESKYNIKPTFYLKGNLNIIKGDGSFEGPYELGVNNESQKQEGQEG